MSGDPQRLYRFAGRDGTGWILGLHGPQCLTLAASVICASLAVTRRAPVLALGVVVAGVGFVFGRVDGIPFLEWLPPRVGWCVRRALSRTRAGKDQPFPEPDAEVTVHAVADPLWAHRTRPDAVAVVEDRRLGTVTATVRVTGPGLALAEPGERDRLVAGWGEALSAFCVEDGPVAWVRWTEWAGPSRLDSVVAHFGERRTADADDPAVVSYRALLRDAADAGRGHETHVSVTVGARRLGRRPARRTSGAAPMTTVGIDEAVDVLLDEVRLLGLRLEAAGLAVDPPLSPAELTATVNRRLGARESGGDPGGADRRPSLAEQAGRVNPPRPGAGCSPIMSASAPVREHRDCFEVGGLFHRGFKVAQWPRRDVPAGWLEPLLLDGGGTRTVSVTCFPVAPSRSARQVNRDSTRIVTDAELRDRKGFRVGVRQRRAQAAVAEREEELAAGHGEVEYAGLVVVSAPDRASLEASAAEYRQLAARSGLELHPVEARHDLAVAAVLPLGRPLPKGFWT